MMRLAPVLLALCVLVSGFCVVPSSHASDKPAPQLFGKGHPFGVEDLPDGELKNQLRKLSASDRDAALKRLHKHVYSGEELKSLRTDSRGMLYYTCDLNANAQAFIHAGAGKVAASTAAPRANVPISSPPAYHSHPGSTHMIYLDFSGFVVTGTGWNDSFGVSTWDTFPLDMDGDLTTFNDAEQTFMFNVWQRVSEDYSPFDIDVTTERPATFNVNISHVLITKDQDKNGNACPHANSSGGIAFLDVFGQNEFDRFYSPCWVYYENLPKYGTPPPLPQPFEDLVSEACSHEAGHNMGLSHQGTTTSAYYGGHGTGATSWGPIMGTGYGRNVSQWCKGEYFNANNTEDALAIIAGKLSYRPDDHGNTDATASTLALTSATTISSTDPKNRGILESTSDVDVFVFATGAGPVTLNITPFHSSVDTAGGNVDVRAELYDSNHVLQQTSAIAGSTSATISATLTAGVYYLHVMNKGEGTPLNNPPDGYTNYGCVGQYFIDGTVVPDVIAPTAVFSLANVTLYGGTSQTFTVTYSDNFGIDVSTLGNGNVRVTSPAGFDVPATFVSVDSSVHGTPRVATYRFTPPGGFWDAGDNNTYTATVQPNQVRDISGNPVAPTSQTFTVNVPAFSLASVSGPANGSYKAGTNLDFSVNYTQPVTVTGSPLIGLTIGSASVNAAYVSGSGTNTIVLRYVVQPGDNDSDGIASATPIVLNGGTIKNGSGADALLAFTPPDTSAVIVDTTAPNISSVTPPANASYGTNRHLDFTVNFNEQVFVTGGTPTIALTIGSTARSASYFSGGGSAALVFRYTVQAGEADADGIDNASPVLLNGAAIRDAAGNNAVLTFTPPVTTGVVVDTVPPIILSVLGPSDGTYIAGQFLDFVVQFDNIVYVTNGTPTIALTVASSPTLATYVSGSGTAFLTFRHVVVAGEVDAGGVTCSSPIVLNGAFIQDPSGNDAILTFSPPTLSGIIVDAPVTRVTVLNAFNSGAGSLRQAIIDVPAGGIIDFDPVFFSVQRTINTTSEIFVNKDMTISGPGANLLTVAGNSTTELFSTGGKNVGFVGMTFTGAHGFIGGALVSTGATGSLKLIDCTLTGNVGLFGGAVYSQGALTMIGCTVSNNVAGGSIGPSGHYDGGGVGVGGGTLSMVNCTVSGNSVISAGGSGGGVMQFAGSSSIVNCTITNNSINNLSDNCGGVYNLSGPMYLFNTIVAGNETGAVPDLNGSANITSQGYNIIGDAGSSSATTSFVNGVHGDQVGTSAAILDPVIGPLADNGGPTLTHLIRPNSKAYDKGANVPFSGALGPAVVAPLTDQRSFARPHGVSGDIGAVEAGLQISPATIPAIAVNTLYSTVTFSAVGGTPAYNLAFSGSLPNGMTCNGTTLSGTPTQAGSFPFTITGTDSDGVTGQRGYTLHVSNGTQDLIVGLTHVGNFTQAQTGAQYTITVSNNGTASTSGAITATMTTLPAGLTPTSFTGTGWAQNSLTPPTATFSGTLTSFAIDNRLTLTVNVDVAAATPLTPVVTVAGGGETDTSNDTANDPTIVEPNEAPQIFNATAHQNVNDNATIAPFVPVTVFDANSLQTLSTSVQVSDTSHGDLTVASVTAAGFTNGGSGQYTFSGTAAITTSAIRQLVFKPISNRVTPGAIETTFFSIAVNDGIAAITSNGNTSVDSLSIDDASSITGAVGGQTVNDTGTLSPFTGVTISDVDPQTFTVTVTLDTAAKGSFTTASLGASGFADSGGGVYTFTGGPAAATTAIRVLVFAPAQNRVAPGSTETTTLTIAVNDGILPAVSDSTTTVISKSINDAPQILGVDGGQKMNDNETLELFHHNRA